MSDTIRIAIAEDSVILRDGLAQLLAGRGFEVTDAVGDPDALATRSAAPCLMSP